jgi:hypothetical protein
MHDPFDNPETAAASRVRGGGAGPGGRPRASLPASPSERPALPPAGAFALFRARASRARRPGKAPRPATTPRRPGPAPGAAS